ncbi:MAG TPA: DNA-formamidopyrimidine glycosylase family protein [Pseudomonadales bacterium]|nr:DNA-formamidopyrimidine glycosylase family protein [Pseudomonadales bacterium]
MPEIPDLTIYLEALDQRLRDRPLNGIRVSSPFILRSVSPTAEELSGRNVIDFRRIGKRIVIGLEGSTFIVIHLMIAGRLRWHKSGAKIPARLGLMAFDFDNGSLILTEASGQHRASVYLVRGEDRLAEFDAGGREVFNLNRDEFVSVLSSENHTLKRSLTDQRLIAGIGNAYSDEILHRSRLSPMRQVKQLDDEQWTALYNACTDVLGEWIERLREQNAGGFPEKVTAFHDEMAVHGKYKQPCPDCGKPVQRIRYASNECNYCAVCQNQGNLLADRSLSRLLKKDWPKTLDELETG